MTADFDLGAMLSSDNSNKVHMISCDELVPYHNHKFSLYYGERLEDMVESIKQNGIFSSLVVQPTGTGKYEILIGHNRWNAAKLAGLAAVPCVIKSGLTEEEAEIYVTESNVMQRGFDNLKISEQAEALRIRHDTMFSQGKRNDIIRELEQLNSETTSSPMDTKSQKDKTTMDKVGEEYGMSRAKVARLLRICKLCDNIKQWVDEGLIALRVGVDLSYLTDEEQELIACEEPKKLTMKVSAELKARSGTLTEDDIDEIVNGKEDKPKKPKAVKIEYDSYSRFFAEGTKTNEIQETIIKALEAYFNGGFSDEYD